MLIIYFLKVLIESTFSTGPSSLGLYRHSLVQHKPCPQRPGLSPYPPNSSPRTFYIDAVFASSDNGFARRVK